MHKKKQITVIEYVQILPSLILLFVMSEAGSNLKQNNDIPLI